MIGGERLAQQQIAGKPLFSLWGRWNTEAYYRSPLERLQQTKAPSLANQDSWVGDVGLPD